MNRLVLDRLGDRGYRWLVGWLSRGDGGWRAQGMYACSPLHRALWPLVALTAR